MSRRTAWAVTMLLAALAAACTDTDARFAPPTTVMENGAFTICTDGNVPPCQ